MKTQIIGILLIVGGFAGMIWQSTHQAELQRQQMEEARKAALVAEANTPEKNAEPTTAAPKEATTPFGSASSATDPIQNSGTSSPSLVKRSSFAATEATGEGLKLAEASAVRPEEKTYTIENEFIRVTFSNYGGAIKHVAFIGRDKNDNLLYPAAVKSEEPYLFNRLNPLPALALNWDADGSGRLSEFAPIYELIAQKDTVIQFRLRTEEGIEIIRGYKVRESSEAEGDPYVIQHETRFINHTQVNQPLNTLYVNLGTLPPTEGDNMGQYLNFAYLNALDGDLEMIRGTQFKNSDGFLGFGKHTALPFVRVPDAKNNAPLEASWAAVKNQFFIGIAMPTEPGSKIYANGYSLGLDEYKRERVAINGYLGFDFEPIPAGQDRVLGLDYYVGPKEVRRLDSLGDRFGELMQFGWGPFGFLAQLLLAALTAIHNVVALVASEWAWGISIITLTCLVKGGLFPLTAIQIRSSKKMQLIAEPMKTLREKYKDNPQKLQGEMMKLFKENQVNPAAGCLPILVQFPIFIGLFYMLQTASELRFGSFLWIQDLSVPDTVSWLPVIPYEIWLIGGPIHILPILMCVSMYYQMKMMPTPATDNMQIKMLKWMPFIFFPITYSFPSGVTLYWTVSNVLTILQTYLTRDMRNAPVVTPEAATPAKKKPARRTNKKK